MIWFVISIVLLLFSAAVTGIALSNNVKGAGIGLIPGLVGSATWAAVWPAIPKTRASI